VAQSAVGGRRQGHALGRALIHGPALARVKLQEAAVGAAEALDPLRCCHLLYAFPQTSVGILRETRGMNPYGLHLFITFWTHLPASSSHVKWMRDWSSCTALFDLRGWRTARATSAAADQAAVRL
jgi:hypothetical protein